MPATAIVLAPTDILEPVTPAKRPAATPSAAGKKVCIIHPTDDRLVSVKNFDLNELTSSGLHVVCKSCAQPGDMERRTSHARHQLQKAGLSPFCPITMTQNGAA